MVPNTDLDSDDLKSILSVFSQSTQFPKEMLEDIVRALALCHLKTLTDFPGFGPELDLALDKDFGFNNRTLAAKLKPTKLLAQAGLINEKTAE